METVIVVSNCILRKGLKTILSEEKDIKVVGEGSNVSDGVKLIITQKPDIALIDLNLGNEDGLLIIDEVRKENLNCRCIVLSNSYDLKDFKRIREHEVEGYILIDALAEEFIYAVHIVQAGKKYYDANLMINALNSSKSNFLDNNNLLRLTKREVEVLTAMGNGLSNIQMANKLEITEYTVKKHVSNVLSKLNFKDRTQAALFANSQGLIR